MSQIFENIGDRFMSWLDRLTAYAPLLETSIMGQPLWRYIGYLFWLIMGLILLAKTRTLLEEKATRWLRAYRDSFQVRLLKRLILPLRLFLLIILVFEGLELFSLVSKELVRWHGQIYTLGMGLCATMALIRIVEVVLWQWKHNHRQTFKEDLNGQLYLLVDKGTQLFIVVLMALTTLHNMGINITSLLTSLSIGSLALALAAQDTLANLFGAVSILADNTFRLGDRIKVDGVEGSVENIGMRSTQVRNLEGHLVTIPNKTLANTTVVNVSQREIWKASWIVDLAYDMKHHQLARACEIFEEVYRGDSRTHDIIAGLKSFGEKSPKIEVNHAIYVSGSREYLQAVHALNLKVKERFENEKIHFAAEAPTIYISKNQ